MGVPNTSTFSLQDVTNVVNPTTDDLVDCFADAVANKFDSSYSGSKNQLLNFRNYDSTSLTPFTCSGNPTEAIPCNEPTSNQITAYHDGSGPGPSVNDYCYFDSAGNSPMSNKSRKYFPTNSVEVNAAFATNFQGTVTSRSNC